MRCLLALIVTVALISSTWAEASGFLKEDSGDRLSTVPHDSEMAAAVDESSIDEIAVRYTGWDETLQTWSRVKLHEITGRAGIHGQDPVYTILSMIYEPRHWWTARVLPVEHPDLLTELELDGKWVSPAQVIDSPHKTSLQIKLLEMEARRDELKEVRELHSFVSQVVRIGRDRPGVVESVVKSPDLVDEVRRLVESPEAWDEAVLGRKELAATVAAETAFFEAGARLLNRAMSLFELPEEFLIVPDPETATGDWIAAKDASGGLREGETRIQAVALKSSPTGIDLEGAAATLHQTLSSAFTNRQAAIIPTAVDNFLDHVERSRHYPDRAHRLKMNIYTGVNPMRKASLVYGLSIILFGLFLFFRNDKWRYAATIALTTGLLMHTFGVVMRLIITERMPVSNMYESITFTSWCALLLGLGMELWKRKGIIGLAASIVGFLMLTGVSLMPLHETRIHPLRAVLNSYWLNIHVTAMLASYGAFAVSAVFATIYLGRSILLSLTGRETLRAGATPLMPLDQVELFAYRLIQIGWPILTIGVALGAVWADTAWGRFWGWDPKETWAFITWIVYTIYLHTRMIMGMRGVASAVVCLLGFVMVMITWLGVSYIDWFAGGLHTYASPT